MKILIDKNGDELYLFRERKDKRSDWILDTVCEIDRINRLLGRIYDILDDKIKKEDGKNGDKFN